MIIKNKIFVALFLLASIVGCVSSEHRAEEFCAKGMFLLDKDTKGAEKAFKDALVMKNNMVEAIYGLALVREHQGAKKETYKYLNEALEQNPKYIQALIKSCQLLLDDRSLDLALIRCNKALETNQNNVMALNLRAEIQLELDDPAGAISFANQAIAVDPDNQEALFLLAQERLLAKDNMKAIAYLEKALAGNEINVTGLLIKATVLENTSETQKAEWSYKKAMDLFPSSIFARKCYVNFLLKQARTADAEQQLRKIAESEDPDDIQAKLDVVKFVTSTKGGESGQAELESIVKKEPENYGLAFVLLNLYRAQKESKKEDELLNEIVMKAGKTADGYRARGLVAEKRIHVGRKDEAERILNEILDDDNRNAQALILKASLAIDAKDYSGAIANLRSVLNDSPKSSSVAFMLASTYESSRLMVLAEEQYFNAYTNSKFSSAYGEPYAKFLSRIKQTEQAEKVLKEMRINSVDILAETKNTLPNQIYAAVTSSMDDIDGSLSAYKRANETDSNDSKPILAVINTYIQAEKYDEALNFINTALISNPENMDLLLAKAQTYDLMGDVPKTIQVLKDLINTDTGNSLAYQQLARIYRSSNQYEEAQEVVSKGLSFLPDDFELKLSKARTFEASGHHEDAIKLYEKMLENRPDSIMASNNLSSLLLDYRKDNASLNRVRVLADSFKKNHASQFLDTYGRICYATANMPEAEQVLNLLKANVENYPKNAAYQYHLAKLYLAKSDRVGAKKAFEDALNNSINQQFEQKEEVNRLLETL